MKDERKKRIERSEYENAVKQFMTSVVNGEDQDRAYDQYQRAVKRYNRRIRLSVA